MAAIALLRIDHYTQDAAYREKAEQTLETFAGVAGQFGIFAATYGIAALHLLEGHTQVVVIDEADGAADQLYGAAVEQFRFAKSTLRLLANQVVAQNLPPVLAETLPKLPPLGKGKSFAVVCSGSTCRPPSFGVEEMRRELHTALSPRS